MNKKVLLVILFLPLVALLGWVSYLYVQQSLGQNIKVAVTGYDPRDLLSGHYIQYTIDWDRTDCTQFSDGICPENEFCKKGRWGRQCRFYIPQKNARELDSLFWKRNTTDMIFEVIYSYRRGSEPIAKQLLINGKDWREMIEK